MRSNATPGSGGGIPFYDRFVYALSSGFSSNLAVYIFSYYLTFFLVDVRGLPARLAGFIILGSRVFDTVTDFLIGMLIDRTHFKSGKYRGWIKLGMIPMLVGLPLIFADLGQLSMTVKIIWTVITYGLYGSVFTTILYTPTNAQLVNMTRDVEERSSMVGLREIFNNVAVMLVSAGFLPLVQLLGGGDEDRGFFLTTAVLAVLAFDDAAEIRAEPRRLSQIRSGRTPQRTGVPAPADPTHPSESTCGHHHRRDAADEHPDGDEEWADDLLLQILL